MAETKQPTYWKLDDPRGLKGQQRAVALMHSDERASYKHLALIDFHWGWAHEKYGWTSLASVRRIHDVLTERNPLGKPGMTTRHINSGNRDLVEWGWLFELDKGKGRDASRFLPNYMVFEIAAAGDFSKFLSGEISCSVSHAGTHNGYEILRIPLGDTDACTYEVHANRFSVSPVGNKDSLTWTGLQDGPTERDIEPAAPTAPPVAGLSAALAVTAGDEMKATTTTTRGGFDELWEAYGYKRGKPEARRAYAKLAPDAEMHAKLVEAARAWQQSWSAQNKPDAPRFTLAKWIDREEFECEPPTAFKPKERKAKRSKPDRPAAEPDEGAPSIPIWARGQPGFWPDGSYPVKIIGSEVHGEDSSERAIILQFLILGGDHVGEEREHILWVKSEYSDRGREGVEYLRAIMRAINEPGPVDDTEALHDRLLRATVAGSSIEYSALSEDEFNAAADLDRVSDPERLSEAA
jgi:hypothetical protein